MRKYQYEFCDRFGCEKGIIHANGSDLFLSLRGIEFEGIDFECLELQTALYKDKIFTIDESNCLTNFSIKVYFPVKIKHNNTISEEIIVITIEVGILMKISSSCNTVELQTAFGYFHSKNKVECFENSILEIQNQFPNNTQFITCLSCRCSHYHPVGNGMFGHLYCFKNIKEKLSSINDKSTLMDLLTAEAVDSGTIYNVHELFDCPEFEYITENDWVYKDWL